MTNGKAFEVLLDDDQRSLQEELKKAEELLSDLPRAYEMAVYRSLNDAAATGKVVAAGTISHEYYIKSSTVKRNFRIGKANSNNLSASVYTNSPRIPLVQYKVTPNPKDDTTGKKRKQVRVAVKKKGGLKPLAQSFIYKGKVLQRLGPNSHPVQEKFGPAIPMAANNPVISENVMQVMRDKFFKRLDHHSSFLFFGGERSGLQHHNLESRMDWSDEFDAAGGNYLQNETKYERHLRHKKWRHWG